MVTRHKRVLLTGLTYHLTTNPSLRPQRSNRVHTHPLSPRTEEILKLPRPNHLELQTTNPTLRHQRLMLLRLIGAAELESPCRPSLERPKMPKIMSSRVRAQLLVRVANRNLLLKSIPKFRNRPPVLAFVPLRGALPHTSYPKVRTVRKPMWSLLRPRQLEVVAVIASLQQRLKMVVQIQTTSPQSDRIGSGGLLPKPPGLMIMR